MTRIIWDENLPSDGSAVGLAPDDLQSLWRNLGQGLRTSLEWSSGDLLEGKVRTFLAGQSSSSNSTAKLWARAFFASDTTRLFVYDSTGTYLAGTPYVIEEGRREVGGTEAVWVSQSSTTLVAAAGAPVSLTIPFPTAYANILGETPRVMQTISHRSMTIGLSTITRGGFTSIFSYFGPGSQSAFTIHWASVGRMTGAI